MGDNSLSVGGVGTAGYVGPAWPVHSLAPIQPIKKGEEKEEEHSNSRKTSLYYADTLSSSETDPLTLPQFVEEVEEVASVSTDPVAKSTSSPYHQDTIGTCTSSLHKRCDIHAQTTTMQTSDASRNQAGIVAQAQQWIASFFTGSTEDSAAEAEATSLEQDETSPGMLEKLYNVTQWVWGLIFSQESEVSASGVEKHLTPEQRQEIEKLIAAMQQLIVQIKDKTDMAEYEEKNFDLLPILVLKKSLEYKKEESALVRERLKDAHAKKQEANKARLEAMDELTATSKRNRTIGAFDEITSTLGLAASALGLSTGWGTVVFLVAVGTTADRMFDDFTKKKLAEAMGGGDKETEDNWLYYLRMGTMIVSFMAASGSSFAGGQLGRLLNGLIGASRGTATLAKGFSERSHNLHNAKMTEVTDQVFSSDEKLKESVKGMKKQVEAMCQAYHTMSTSARNQLETSLSMIKS